MGCLGLHMYSGLVVLPVPLPHTSFCPFPHPTAYPPYPSPGHYIVPPYPAACLLPTTPLAPNYAMPAFPLLFCISPPACMHACLSLFLLCHTLPHPTIPSHYLFSSCLCALPRTFCCFFSHALFACLTFLPLTLLNPHYCHTICITYLYYYILHICI